MKNIMAKELARLTLPKLVLRRLDSAGVFCQTWVTVERQALADRWVIRGVESGGGNREVGRYISYFASDGARLACVQKVDRLGGNGVHGVVVAPELVAVEMARIAHTYQLLITQHSLGPGTGKRPSLDSKIVFQGVDGQLSADLLKQGLTPEFFTRSGEVRAIPASFHEAVRLVTAGASCSNCRHCHGLVERAEVVAEGVVA
jgi:hypothetical protein